MKDWKKIVKGLAPTIATALGGPYAGAATKFLAESLLGDKDAPEAAIEAALINASPDQLAQLREIDNKFAIRMAELDVDIFNIEVQDKKSARDMAKTNMWPQVILSIVFIGGYFALMYMLFSGEVEISPSIKDMAYVLVGLMTGEIPRIMAFWFGSSHGSQKKTEIMKK